MMRPGRGRAARAALCAGACALLLTSALAAQRPARYAVGTVRVQSGNGIRENPEGVLFSASFDAECQLRLNATPAPALSASLHAPVPAALGVEVIGCPALAPPPRLDCRVDVGGATHSSPPGYRGWNLTLPLPLPAVTGIYPASLRCTVEDSPFDAPPATLYLTYAPPLSSVDPPEVDWYRRACTWGAGISGMASEEVVLQTILDHLYAHGQRHWRYGYCRIETTPDGPTCSFGTTSIRLPDARLECFPDFRLCKCVWQTLVSVALEDSVSNFADCFVFTDTLQYVNATMGVGGIAQEQLTGAHQLGFDSLATTRSIDPAFTGNFDCGSRQLPCSYAFHNHDVASWGPLTFDATFGNVYRDLGQLIGASVVEQDGFNLRFPAEWACFERYGYGLFRFYTGAASCPQDRGAATFAVPAAAALTPSVVDKGRGLEVVLGMEIHQPGEYRVIGGIYGGQRGLSPVVLRPADRLEDRPASATVADPVGPASVRLVFSGEELARSTVPGPYFLHAAIQSARGIVDRVTVPMDLHAISLAALGERVARFGDPAAIRAEIVRDGSGRPVVRVRAPVTVRQAGKVVLEGRLARGNATLAYAGVPVDLGHQQELTLDFPVDAAAGAYEVTLGLTEADPVRYVDSVRATVTLPPPPGEPHPP